MGEEDQVLSEDKTVISDDSINDNKDTEALANHSKRLLAETKKAKEESRVAKAEVEKFRQAELESKGKDKELVESLRKQLSDKDNETKSMKQNFAFNLYSKAVTHELDKAGAIDPDLLLGQIDINSVEMNDDFTFNLDDIKREVLNLVSKKPKQFQKRVVEVRDGIPKKVESSTTTDLSKMTLAQKMQKLSELTTQGAYNKK